MTELARQAFKEQMDETPGSEYLFPTPEKEVLQALHYNTQDNLDRNTEKGWCPLLPDLSSAPHCPA